MPSTCVGTIDGFAGSWSSGLGFLIIDGRPVPCENAPTIRALEACYGGVIAADHRVDGEAIEGKRVVYSIDDFGLLLGFTPEEDWEGPEIPEDGLDGS